MPLYSDSPYKYTEKTTTPTPTHAHTYTHTQANGTWFIGLLPRWSCWFLQSVRIRTPLGTTIGTAYWHFCSQARNLQECLWYCVGTQSQTTRFVMSMWLDVTTLFDTGSYSIARYTRAMGIKWLVQSHNSKVQVGFKHTHILYAINNKKITYVYTLHLIILDKLTWELNCCFIFAVISKVAGASCDQILSFYILLVTVGSRTCIN